MKKTLIILIVLVIVILGVLLTWNFLTIKPFLIEDIVSAESSYPNATIGLSYEESPLNTWILGSLNWHIEGWADDNKAIDGKKRPLIITVLDQQGSVPAQIIKITDNNGEIINVYLPSIPGDNIGWAWFYIDNRGSSYWGCPNAKTCDGGVIGSERTLKKENLARKAP